MTDRPARPLVLVHGARHGGWCWRRVRAMLCARGHVVFTPTLTGLGERVHLRRRGDDLDLHVKDIVNVIEYEDLRDAVLCGHSYAGMVITGVADRLAERLAALVYVDAYVPDDGQSVFDLRPAGMTAALLQQVDEEGDGWLMPPTSAAAFRAGSEADPGRGWTGTACRSPSTPSASRSGSPATRRRTCRATTSSPGATPTPPSASSMSGSVETTAGPRTSPTRVTTSWSTGRSGSPTC
ncbi:MAG: alpha/beta hydrolase [Gammaproteobacteria bacterium]|nr:alpha/beta hydrolase [Gammaproteobacteria bacterium]